MKRWLLPEEGVEQMMYKITVEQFVNISPQELRIWEASHNPGPATTVAELIKSYDLANSPFGNRVRTRYQDYRPSSRPLRKNSWQQEKQNS